MDEQMTKAKLLDELRSAREEWDGLMAEIGEDRMTEPGATGYWSVKDVMNHLTCYTCWFVNAIEAHLRGKAPPLDGTEGMPLQEKNDFYYQKTKDMPLQQALRESHEVHQRLIQLVEGFSEAFVTQPQQFIGVPMPILIWQPLKSEVYDHSRLHLKMLRDWLAR
jgi:hypothetical protein